MYLLYKNKLRTYLLNHYRQFERWRWVFIALVGMGLFLTEVYEFIQLSFLNQPLHIVEVILYGILIIGIGLFVELFVRLNRIHKRTTKILEYKHSLGLEFTTSNDWDSLTTKLAQLPSKIVEVDEAYLLTRNLVSGKFDILSHWTDNQEVEQAPKWDPITSCPRCPENNPGNKTSIHLCWDDNETSPYNAYSLSIINEHLLSTLLKFRLKPGLLISPDEEKIFLNISDEIAVAIRLGQERKALSELRSAEVAMAERRLVSTYIHDQLGQNLAYMQLKLDQLGSDENLTNLKVARKDLKQLRVVANESYEIVRGILKKLQPETIPNLTNLLKEHATTVSKEANFILDFKSIGAPLPLPSNTQHSIFYAFREILGNVGKHSKANRVIALVTWSDSFLDISVADNGVGFDPDGVNKEEHFGLDILRERIEGLRGKLMMSSSFDSGTIISISIPV